MGGEGSTGEERGHMVYCIIVRPKLGDNFAEKKGVSFTISYIQLGELNYSSA